MTERLRCCVPFCECTTDRTEFSEWLCRNHWPLVSQQHRRVYGRLTKRWRRYHREEDGIRADRIWRVIKRRAIEAAAGIR